MMVNRGEWEAAYRDVLERGRERAGDPPTPEELVAWSRGKLPENEAERIRELLAYYPDLAQALAEGDAAADDEPPILTREHLATDWELLQERMSPTVRPHVAAAASSTMSSDRRIWLIAALIPTFLFAGLWVQSRLTIRTLQQQLVQPRTNLERVVLLENMTRGGSAATPVKLQDSTGYVLLTLTVVNAVKADAFHVPRSFLTSRTYAVDLYADKRQIGTYDLWLSRG
jgi:hypothetical protein